jgi:hypothetical protein
MYISLANALLLVLLTSSRTSVALPLPVHCSNRSALSCHMKTSTSITKLAYTTSSTPLSGRTGSKTTNASSSNATDLPGHCLEYFTEQVPTICHRNTNCTTAENLKPIVDTNTIVGIVFGAAQVLLSIWPTQAAWRFLRNQTHEQKALTAKQLNRGTNRNWLGAGSQVESARARSNALYLISNHQAPEKLAGTRSPSGDGRQRQTQLSIAFAKRNDERY